MIMKIKLDDIKKLVEEQLEMIRGGKDTKKFYFTNRDLSQLESSTNAILSAVLEKVPGVMGETSIGYSDLLSKEYKEPAQLRKVAEGEVVDASDRFRGRRGTAKSQFSPEEEEERQKLRSKYYGPEGDIATKTSAKARKGLEKGIGELSPEEFEQAGYVLEVPKEVLEDFSVMVQELERAGNLFEEAKDWYHSINRLMLKETGSEEDAALFGLLVATYSPRAKFSLNLMEAAFMYKAVARDAKSNPELLREYAETFPVKKPTKPEAEKPSRKIGYLKVANFALNLIAPDLAGARDPDSGELLYNEEYRWNSTIDTWMIDAFYPSLRKASTAKEYTGIKGKMMSDPFTYTYLSELVAREAKKLDLLPHELQAIIWVAMKRRQSGEDAATTQESIGQIEQSLKNIAEHRGDLERLTDELENGSNWVRVLFKEIEEAGFASASDYVLGIKQDKKWIAPGLRSLAARGKSGDQFKYYPDEPKEPSDAPRKAKKKKPAGPTPEKPAKAYEDPKYSSLASFYVMNNVIQMPTGKFGNLYNSILMYLQPGFSVAAAVDSITGAFDRSAKAGSRFLEHLFTT